MVVIVLYLFEYSLVSELGWFSRVDVKYRQVRLRAFSLSEINFWKDWIKLNPDIDWLLHYNVSLYNCLNLELFSLLFDGELFGFIFFVRSELYTENARRYRRQS